VNDIAIERLEPSLRSEAAASETVVPIVAAEPLRTHPARSWASVGIFFLLLLAGMAYAREFLMPVALAFLLALIFTPVRRFLDRRGIPSGLSAILIVGGLLAVIVVGILVLSGPVSDWVARAPSIFSDLQTKMRALRGVAATVAEVGNQVENITKSPTGSQVPEVAVKQPGIAASLAWIAPVFLAQLVFVLVLIFFLLSSGDMVYEKIVHVLPTLTDKKRAMRIAHDIESKLSTYLFTITTINVGLGIVIGLVMWAIGMPNPLLFGVGAFALNYIPFIGPFIATVFPTLFAMAQFESWQMTVVVFACLNLIQFLVGSYLEPRISGSALSISPSVVLFAVFFWTFLWGIAGTFIGVPIMIAVLTICKQHPSSRWISDLLGTSGEKSRRMPMP